VKQTLISFLLARFIPNRTATGIGLYLVAEIIKVVLSSPLCGASPATCDFVLKAQSVITPWLVIAGIRDAGRK
jgi:hypothetical protein